MFWSAEKVREFRERFELSQEDLAREAGCSLSLLSRIERGDSPISRRMEYSLNEARRRQMALEAVKQWQIERNGCPDEMTPLVDARYAREVDALLGEIYDVFDQISRSKGNLQGEEVEEMLKPLARMIKRQVEDALGVRLPGV